MPIIPISNLADLSSLVTTTLEKLPVKTNGATVLGLSGDLGTGKTTFTQILAQKLGVTAVVTSPTYLIIKSYSTTNPVFTSLVHIDAYRIQDLAELVPLRFAELLGLPNTLLVIEWVEQIAAALPTDTPIISLELQADGTRTATTTFF